MSDPRSVAQIEPVKVQAVAVELPKPTPTASVVDPRAEEPVTAVPAKSDPGTSQITTAHSRSSPGPISTGTAASSSKSQVIVLTTGNKVEADQVWRTKDGVWYRKNGIVTLLQKSRVRAIIDR